MTPTPTRVFHLGVPEPPSFHGRLPQCPAVTIKLWALILAIELHLLDEMSCGSAAVLDCPALSILDYSTCTPGLAPRLGGALDLIDTEISICLCEVHMENAVSTDAFDPISGRDLQGLQSIHML